MSGARKIRPSPSSMILSLQLVLNSPTLTKTVPLSFVKRSSTGAIERIMAFLIEHYGGAFPLWLSPIQVKAIPVRTNHNEYAEKIHKMLIENGIRSEIALEDENLGTKVRDAKNDKIPYWIVLGDKEMESGKVTLESRDQGQFGQISVEKLLEKLKVEIKNKS